LLKEIKLLRLEHLRRPTGEATAQARETIAASTNLWRTLPLSLGEDVAWYLSLVLVAAAVGLFTLWFAVSPEAMVPTVESYVTLAPDGSGTETMKVSYPYSGWVPRTSFPFTTSDPNASIRWVDSQGRQLPATVTTSDGQRRYTVRLVEPAMPGGQVRYTQITEVPALAASKDDLWTCRGYRAFGVAKNGSPPGPGLIVGPTLVDSRERQAEFSETVQLPEGAEIVKADPKPLGLFIWDGTPARFFTATRGRNEAFTYTIQYRLPKSNTHSETAK
jgi:hypothetical protein